MKILKNKSQLNKLLLLALGLLLYVGATFFVIHVIYDNETVSIMIKKAVQNFTYIILFTITIALMKISKISFKKYGLFLSKFSMQMLLGVIVSIIMLIVQLIFFRSIPQILNQLIYTLMSQLIVSIS